VRFWDSSAILLLCLEEPSLPLVKRLLDEDSGMAIWWGTPVECFSALARRLREGSLGSSGLADAKDVLRSLESSWYLVRPSQRVQQHAIRLMFGHPLRAGDALQLGAALTWSEPVEGRDLVSFDSRLREAALREGFRILPSTLPAYRPTVIPPYRHNT